MEKDATQERLEKLHGVLETERSALREVLKAARKAVDDLKVEKQEVEDNLTKEQETNKWQAEEIERLKRLQGGDSSQTTILNQQITTLNQTITELRQTITEHTQTINQLRTENSSLQQQLEDARRNGGNQQSQHQAELDRMAARMPPPGASSGGGDTRQLEAQNKKNIAKLQNVQRECGIRWMNHILARHRLHSQVATFVWWKCYANAQLGSSVAPDVAALRAKHAQEMQMLTDQKDEELKAQLAQAGRGLKRWMEDRELEGLNDAMRRKQQGLKMLCKVLAQWANGTVAGCVIQWKLNLSESSTANLTDRYNAAMVAKLRMLRRQSAVLAMKEIITRWINTEQNLGFMRWHQNLNNDKALKKLFLLQSKAKDAGMASHWKDEAERVAALFDKRKASFESTQVDQEHHRKDLQDRYDAKLAELARIRAECNVAVGDLALQMNQSETDRQTCERLSEINQHLENVVRNHVVEGAVMRGKLQKQGSVLSGGVNPRWCVLDARQLSLFEDQSESLAKTVIPLKDIKSVAPDDFKEFGFQVHLKDNKEAREHQKTETFRFAAHSADDLKAWLAALQKLQGNQPALNESWDQIQRNYKDEIKLLTDSLSVQQQNATVYKTDCTQIAEQQMQELEEKYTALLKQTGKIDDDLWMWVERHMWQQTTAQGLGFGEQKMAQALGGSGGIPCHIATNWTDCDGGNAGTEIDEHCSGANDGKNTIYSVNFECPSNMEEVKKLQRLMVLRNPSPPRSRSRGAGDHSASPRGKSPPKKRGTGSISSSPRR